MEVIVKRVCICLLIVFFSMNSKTLKVAHRGASGIYPENTLLAFQKTLETDADMIELDVHRAKDGALVVFHDFELDRVTNGSGPISQKTLAELKKLSVLGPSALLRTGKEKIPTLREVLELLKKKIHLDIELKGANTAKLTADLIKEYVKSRNFNYSNFIVTSFDHPQIIEFHKLLPEIEVGFLYDEKQLPFNLNEIKNRGISWIAADYRDLTDNFIKKAHELGLKILVYTVNDKNEYKMMEKLGVDAVATDFP